MSSAPQTLAKKTRLEGRVAQLLNARELVVNIGGAAGVKVGMKFAVLAETPLEVRDPGTGEVLDKLDREKVRVVASEVRPKITICRTYRVLKVEGGPLSPLRFPAVMEELTRPAREIPETLEASNSSLPPPLAPGDSYVKINDRVVEIEE